MVNRALLYLLLVLLSLPCSARQANTDLEVNLSHKAQEYGKPIKLVLQTRLHGVDIRKIDLAPLEQDFVIEPELDATAGTDRLSVRLYARHTGTLFIPSLKLAGQGSQPVPLIITPAIDRKTGSEIQVQFTMINTPLWVREAGAVNVRISTDSDILALESETFQHSALTVSAYQEDRIIAGTGRVEHQYHWRIQPQSSGTYRVQLPAAKYIRDGVTTHRFHPPQLSLTVRPLPKYIPPTMPVGKFITRLEIDKAPLLVTNSIAYLTIRTESGTAYTKQNTAALRNQLQSNASIHFYAQGSSETGRYPFTVKSSGIHRLPDLKVRFFDPAQGKIVSYYPDSPLLIALPQWGYNAIYLLCVLISGWLAQGLLQWIFRYYYRYTGYAKAVRQLAGADKPEECKMALLTIAQAESWPINLTLQQWLQCWQQHHQTDSGLTLHIGYLQSCLYHRAINDMTSLRRGLLEGICRQITVLRLLRRRIT
ncbi:MAG: hypothetical protein OEZ39_12830 [Gammaproteobacteria bacterium]|nr:hypothetical protein [Gammaproteobacteria bacterium]MDH5652732.1 hypothetical protein [Gammaproteobacteria bacterium]